VQPASWNKPEENANEGLRIAIDAQNLSSHSGGITSALLALIRGLTQLRDGNEKYRLVVASEEEATFWGPELGANQAVVVRADYNGSLNRKRSRPLFGLAARAVAPAKPWIHRLMARMTPPRHWPEVPISDGFHESLGCDVLHLPTQRFTLCALPTIYNPHDLQHLHMPQFFRPGQLAWRETIYSTGCRFARTVVVGSNWAKEDVVRQYNLDPAKVQVIPEGPPHELSPPVDVQIVSEIRKRHDLADGFLLYPAMMWPHKNHPRLLEALALLRDERGLVVPLVCTGQRKQFWPHVEKRIQELGLQRQVRFLGFVPEVDLRVIQRSASGLVFPSLFEASSLPIYDAWLEGVPVACSRVTALPEQVGDAALLFNPLDSRDIADAITILMTKPEVRQDLRKRGFRRLKDFDWGRTARAYRAVYRRAAGVTLNEEDRWLLQWDWMRDPTKVPRTGTIQ